MTENISAKPRFDIKKFPTPDWQRVEKPRLEAKTRRKIQFGDDPRRPMLALDVESQMITVEHHVCRLRNRNTFRHAKLTGWSYKAGGVVRVIGSNVDRQVTEFLEAQRIRELEEQNRALRGEIDELTRHRSHATDTAWSFRNEIVALRAEVRKLEETLAWLRNGEAAPAVDLSRLPGWH